SSVTISSSCCVGMGVFSITPLKNKNPPLGEGLSAIWGAGGARFFGRRGLAGGVGAAWARRRCAPGGVLAGERAAGAARGGGDGDRPPRLAPSPRIRGVGPRASPKRARAVGSMRRYGGLGWADPLRTLET
ncbi:hypothetical protein, partial [Burkholderia pseudomallei]